jgi:hypothetical protein
MPGPIVFDRHLLRLRRRRASVLGPPTFLIDRVAAELTERLDPVMRTFNVAVDLGTPTDAVRRALARPAPSSPPSRTQRRSPIRSRASPPTKRRCPLPTARSILSSRRWHCSS